MSTSTKVSPQDSDMIETRKITYTVVLAGEMGSGKSNILQRYHKNVFTRVSPTIGSEFLTKKIVLNDLVD